VFVNEQTPAVPAATTGAAVFFPANWRSTEPIMSKYSPLAPSWVTSSLGHPADSAALQHAALGDHLAQCSAQRGRLQRLENGAVEFRRLVAGRFVTSALLLTLLIGASLMAL
jgi:hypothetical protein